MQEFYAKVVIYAAKRASQGFASRYAVEPFYAPVSNIGTHASIQPLNMPSGVHYVEKSLIL